MTPSRRGDIEGLLEHNPACSKARCRACLGYGVIVLGTPTYRACRGLEAETDAASLVVWDLNIAGREIPWWRRGARRAHNARFKAAWDRYAELVDALAEGDR